MDKKSIREYAKLMKELELTGLEITEGDKVIRLERQIKEVVTTQTLSVEPEKVQVEKPVENDAADNLISVTSPMVGVFYAAPTEDSDPFVKVGDKVSKGDTLCIVEAMKLMNEITSEYDGTIAEVCLQNGDVVEFGTVIFKIEP